MKDLKNLRTETWRRESLDAARKSACATVLAQPGQFLAIEGVPWKLRREALQQLSRVVPVAVAQRRYGQQQACERKQVMAPLGCEAQLSESLFAVDLRASESQQQAQRYRHSKRRSC